MGNPATITQRQTYLYNASGVSKTAIIVGNIVPGLPTPEGQPPVQPTADIVVFDGSGNSTTFYASVSYGTASGQFR